MGETNREKKVVISDYYYENLDLERRFFQRFRIRSFLITTARLKMR